MSALKFADSHNMVAFLDKPTESEGFEQIVDFLHANPIKYVLTVNPTIYTSCIKQFWATAEVKTVNGEVQLQAQVDGKKVIIAETSVRRVLKLKDDEGIECLPNADIFEQLTLMGYEKPSQKLTFYKAFISPQWKFLIHTILQCLSANSTAWNEFSSTIASSIADEAANEENVPTHSNDLLPSGEDSLKINKLMEICTKLQQRVLDLENTKTAQAHEISSLKLRVKRFEKQGGSRTHKLKRLFKGRKIVDIHQDVEVTLVNKTQERYGDDLVFDAGVLDGEEVFAGQDVVEKEVSAADPVTTAGEVVTTASVDVSTTILTENTTVDELTLAQTLMEIKSAKPKVKKVMVEKPVQSTTTTTPSTISKAKSITFREPVESTTRTTPTSIPSNIKDKGKANMIESEKPLKKKEQIRLDAELALKLQAEEEEHDRLAREKAQQVEEANIS
ncbi:hypothetical protein Tco_0758254 [Tanacetum coccineum]